MLFLIWRDRNGKAYSVDGPFEEHETEKIYAVIDEHEKLYALRSVLTDVYGGHTMHVVRVAHTQEYEG